MAIEDSYTMNTYPENADVETASDDYATRFSGEVGEYFLDVQLQCVLKCLGRVDGASILDVGGGHGQLAIPLVKRGFAVTITGSEDSCESRLKKNLAPESYVYRTCNMLELPYEDKSFDMVLAFRLLPHVDRWQQLITELCRVAKNGVIVDYPDMRSFNVLSNMMFSYKKSIEKNTRPYLLFSHKQVSTPFNQAGFSEVQKIPQFFLPMVLHRKIRAARLSRNFEKVFSSLQFTRFFGSPVVLHMQRERR